MATEIFFIGGDKLLVEPPPDEVKQLLQGGGWVEFAVAGIQDRKAFVQAESVAYVRETAPGDTLPPMAR